MTIITFKICFLTLLLLLLFWIYFKRQYLFWLFIKDIRLERTLHYLLSVLFGIVIVKNEVVLNLKIIVDYILLNISMISAIIFSIMTNNVADYDIDCISNKERPLPQKMIEIANYRKLEKWFLAVSLITAAIIGYKFLLLVAAYIIVYYSYSMPPLRFKRITFFSKTFIAIATLICVIIGYVFVKNNLSGFPEKYIWFILFSLTPTLNFIDLKDYEGAKSCGVKTLPVIFGLKKSKFIIATFFLLSYIIVAFEFLPAIISGVLTFFLIIKENYKYYINNSI